jgi:hypothetical protein
LWQGGASNVVQVPGLAVLVATRASTEEFKTTLTAFKA